MGNTDPVSRNEIAHDPKWCEQVKMILLNEDSSKLSGDGFSGQSSSYLPYLTTALTLAIVNLFDGQRPTRDQVQSLVAELRSTEAQAGRVLNSMRAEAAIRAATSEVYLWQHIGSETEIVPVIHQVLWALSATRASINENVDNLMSDIDQVYREALAGSSPR